MRIVIEIEPSGQAFVSTEAVTTAVPPEPAAEVPSGALEAIDAGPPAHGEQLEPVSETEIHGQAVDAGSAPAITVGEGGQGEARDMGGDARPIDAGEAPDLG